MRLNQVTVTASDVNAAWEFYCGLGLIPVVDNRPHYARFRCPDGDSTFSVEQGDRPGPGTTVYFEMDDLDNQVRRLKAAGLKFTSDPEDMPWLWREAELHDPDGNRIVLFFAGTNRIAPQA